MKWMISVTKVLIDVAPLWHLEGEITRDGLTLSPVGNDAAMPAPEMGWEGCEVRARVRVNASERELLTDAKAQIEARIGPCKRLEVELIAVPDRALRAPAVAVAKTLPDKVKAWADLTGAVASDRVLAKLAAVEHGDPDVLAGDLERDLQALCPAQKASVAA